MVASQYFLGQSQGAVFQAMASLESILQTITGRDSREHRQRRVAIALVFGSLGFWIYAPTAVWWTWLPVGTYIFSSLGKLFYRPWLIRTVWLASSGFTTTYSAICGNWAIVGQQMVVISLSVLFLWRALLEHRKNVCVTEAG